MNQASRRVSELDDQLDAHVDGRTLRRSRNRDAVIVALLDLIREGDLDPGAAEIAERAGVSHRSVFRYFDDLNDLVRTAIDHEFQQAREMSSIPQIGAGSFDERVAAMVDARLALFERVRGTMLVARMKAGSIPAIDEEIATVAELFRAQLRTHFADELAAWSHPQNEFIVDGCLVLTSFEAYDVHTRYLGHSVERMRASWLASVTALLGH
jgi:TetR/AcrR family transcriptional regulator, regulator of autoinduction and epiphytic fitness